MTKSNAQALRDLAEAHLADILKQLPSDRLNRFVMFIEVVRAMDYWSVCAYSDGMDEAMVGQSLDLMYWGWNIAVAQLFEPIEQPGAFPLMESTRKSLDFATGLMQELGKASLARRLADMGDRGLTEIVRDGNEYQVRMSEDAKAQFADAMEYDHLTAAEESAPSSSVGWSMTSMRDALRFPGMPGNYLALTDVPVKRWIRSNIEELIAPLVRPWNTGHGIMVAYDACIEVDKHYMAEALSLATKWREDAGIHSHAKLGPITGADIARVGAALISLHAKHVGCVSVAKRQFPEVSVAQSLTIWEPKRTLEQSISAMSGCSERVVRSAFKAVAMTSEQAKKLANHSTPLIPLLFDLGNGFILRPISCLTRNPLTSARIQHQWLDPSVEHGIAKDREPWMREQLYYMFSGTRYIRFPGSLRLRRNGNVLTDIDAIIYDRLTGDVGLFQLKWQDYSTNDVRELRSKASNLSAELVDWSSKVKSWIDEKGMSSLDKSLRLKRKRREAVRDVLLFAISRSLARTQGYGIKTEVPDLAMAVWPQFVRVRMETGPSARSMRDVHTRLLEEHAQTPVVHPLPTSLRVNGTMLHIHDLWNRVGESDPIARGTNTPIRAL